MRDGREEAKGRTRGTIEHVGVVTGLLVPCDSADGMPSPITLLQGRTPEGRAELSQFVVGGDLDVPEHPPGMPYIKSPPMGQFSVTSP